MSDGSSPRMNNHLRGLIRQDSLNSFFHSSSPSKMIQKKKKINLHEGIMKLHQLTKFGECNFEDCFKTYQSEESEGTMDKDGFGLALGKILGTKLESELSDKLFECFDTDGNKILDRKEFITGTSVMLKGDFKDKSKLLFQMYDANNDGSLTREEMITFIHSLYKSHSGVAPEVIKLFGLSPIADKGTLSIEDITILIDKFFTKLDITKGLNLAQFQEFLIDNPSLINYLVVDKKE